jgi:hypothetical protein
MLRDAVAVGGAAGLGKLESMGHVPARLGGLPTGLVVGGLGAFLLPRFVGGKLGSITHDLSLGALCAAGYQIGGGTPVMGEDGLEGGGWGP